LYAPPSPHPFSDATKSAKDNTGTTSNANPSENGFLYRGEPGRQKWYGKYDGYYCLVVLKPKGPRLFKLCVKKVDARKKEDRVAYCGIHGALDRVEG
jgi:hypothetical protein